VDAFMYLGIDKSLILWIIGNVTQFDLGKGIILKPLGIKRALGGSALIIFGQIVFFNYISEIIANTIKYPFLAFIMFCVMAVAPMILGILILVNIRIVIYLKDKAVTYINRVLFKNRGTAAINKDIEKQLLQLAYSRKGVLTVIDVSLNTEMALEAAQEALEYMVKQGHVKMKIAENGTVLYHFPGILTDKDKKSAKSLDDLLEEKS
jgi:hypothetical protein